MPSAPPNAVGSGADVPVPRPAATVVLLRPGAAGAEVLLTKRPDELRFMGGVTVFPGGAVDDADLDAGWERASSLSPARAADLLGETSPERALSFFVCACREAFEEVGWLETEGDARALERADAGDARRLLHRCLDEGIELRTDQLVPAGRWVTPEGAPVRFDTWFFVARVSGDWEPHVDPSEVAGASWMTPRHALEEQAAGTILMAPPTVEMLQRIAHGADVDEILASLRAQLDDPTASTRLSPFVKVLVAPNPGIMTGPGTNTYVVGSDPAVVIDPAVDDETFLEEVAAAAGRVEQILITHRHEDHVGGAARLASMTGATVRAFGGAPAGRAPVEALADEAVVTAGPVRLTALHTPGHSSDHLCFYLDGPTSLFSGDTVLGEGTAVIAPPDGDMRAYLASLRRLLTYRIGRIYPGHWPALDGGRAVIERYIAHRKDRERAILDAISSKPLSIEEIVARVYMDTPPQLHSIAAYSVRAHLEMLVDTGKASVVNERWSASGVD